MLKKIRISFIALFVLFICLFRISSVSAKESELMDSLMFIFNDFFQVEQILSKDECCSSTIGWYSQSGSNPRRKDTFKNDLDIMTPLLDGCPNPSLCEKNITPLIPEISCVRYCSGLHANKNGATFSIYNGIIVNMKKKYGGKEISLSGDRITIKKNDSTFISFEISGFNLIDARNNAYNDSSIKDYVEKIRSSRLTIVYTSQNFINKYGQDEKVANAILNHKFNTYLKSSKPTLIGFLESLKL